MALVAKLGWRVVAGVSGAVAGAVARKVVTAGWTSVTHAKPPADTQDPRLSWSEALGWAASTAVGLAVARAAADRLAARGWEKAVGSPPPGRRPSVTPAVRPMIDLRGAALKSRSS